MVYLLDGPFAGVDRQHSLLIWKELDRAARNAPVIAISHDQSLPERAAMWERMTGAVKASAAAPTGPS